MAILLCKEFSRELPEDNFAAGRVVTIEHLRDFADQVLQKQRFAHSSWSVQQEGTTTGCRPREKPA
jgi:hypothetical protein